jgi:hypothetical protein
MAALGRNRSHNIPIGHDNRMKQEDIHFQLLLKAFYQRLFPFKEFYKWLSYGGGIKLDSKQEYGQLKINSNYHFK